MRQTNLHGTCSEHSPRPAARRRRRRLRAARAAARRGRRALPGPRIAALGRAAPGRARRPRAAAAGGRRGRAAGQHARAGRRVRARGDGGAGRAGARCARRMRPFALGCTTLKQGIQAAACVPCHNNRDTRGRQTLVARIARAGPARRARCRRASRGACARACAARARYRPLWRPAQRAGGAAGADTRICREGRAWLACPATPCTEHTGTLRCHCTLAVRGEHGWRAVRDRAPHVYK